MLSWTACVRWWNANAPRNMKNLHGQTGFTSANCHQYGGRCTLSWCPGSLDGKKASSRKGMSCQSTFVSHQLQLREQPPHLVWCSCVWVDVRCSRCTGSLDGRKARSRKRRTGSSCRRAMKPCEVFPWGPWRDAAARW